MKKILWKFKDRSRIITTATAYTIVPKKKNFLKKKPPLFIYSLGKKKKKDNPYSVFSKKTNHFTDFYSLYLTRQEKKKSPNKNNKITSSLFKNG